MAKNTNKDELNNIKDSLDALIGTGNPSLAETPDDLPVAQNRERINFSSLKTKAETKAKRTLKTMLKFYLDEGVIESEEYVTAQLNMQEASLTQLIYLMETGERALTSLMQQIDNGNNTSRMYEVLSTLQKSQLDVIKSQTMYLIAAEEASKKMARELEIYSNVESKTSEKNENSNIYRGTKGLMAGIQDEIKEEDIEVIDEIKEENTENDTNTETNIFDNVKE